MLPPYQPDTVTTPLLRWLPWSQRIFCPEMSLKLLLRKVCLKQLKARKTAFTQMAWKVEFRVPDFEKKLYEKTRLRLDLRHQVRNLEEHKTEFIAPWMTWSNTQGGTTSEFLGVHKSPGEDTTEIIKNWQKASCLFILLMTSWTEVTRLAYQWKSSPHSCKDCLLSA